MRFNRLVTQMRHPWPTPAEAESLATADLALRILDRLDVTPARRQGNLLTKRGLVNHEVTQAEVSASRGDGRVTVVDSRDAIVKHESLARAYSEAWDYAVQRAWLADDPASPGYVYVTTEGKACLGEYREPPARRASTSKSRDRVDSAAITRQKLSKVGTDEAVTGAAPSAFISWAHGDSGWTQTVADFTIAMRSVGVDADVDLFHADEAVDWTTYGPQRIEESSFTLLAVSSAYKERWEGRNDPRKGAGAAREANVLKTLFNDDQAEFKRRVKVVVLPGAAVSDIPAELKAAIRHFSIDAFDLTGLTELIRNLTGQPRLRPNPLGDIPVLPETLRRSLDDGTGRTPSPDEPLQNEQALERGLDAVEVAIQTSGAADAAVRDALNTRKSTIAGALRAVQRNEPPSPGQSSARHARRLFTELGTAEATLAASIETGRWWDVMFAGLPGDKWDAHSDELGDAVPHTVFEAVSSAYIEADQQNKNANKAAEARGRSAELADAERDQLVNAHKLVSDGRKALKSLLDASGSVCQMQPMDGSTEAGSAIGPRGTSSTESAPGLRQNEPADSRPTAPEDASMALTVAAREAVAADLSEPPYREPPTDTAGLARSLRTLHSRGRPIRTDAENAPTRAAIYEANQRFTEWSMQVERVFTDRLFRHMATFAMALERPDPPPPSSLVRLGAALRGTGEIGPGGHDGLRNQVEERLERLMAVIETLEGLET